MIRILLVAGPPLSGKSTFIKRFTKINKVNNDKDMLKIINHNDLRKRFNLDAYNTENDLKIVQLCDLKLNSTLYLCKQFPDKFTFIILEQPFTEKLLRRLLTHYDRMNSVKIEVIFVKSSFFKLVLRNVYRFLKTGMFINLKHLYYDYQKYKDMRDSKFGSFEVDEDVFLTV